MEYVLALDHKQDVFPHRQMDIAVVTKYVIECMKFFVGPGIAHIPIELPSGDFRRWASANNFHRLGDELPFGRRMARNCFTEALMVVRCWRFPWQAGRRWK